MTWIRVAAPGARSRIFSWPGWRPLLGNAPVVVMALAVGAAGIAVLSGSWQVRPIVSGSMRPALEPGGVVVTEREPISDLRVGDVIVFRAPNNPEPLIVHRVTDIRPAPGGLMVTTKGDANSTADLWSPFLLRGPYIYREHFTLPLIGYAGVAVHSPAAQILLLWGGGLLALVALVLMFIPQRDRTTARAQPTV